MNITGDALVECEDKKSVYLIENGNEQKVGTTTERISFLYIEGRVAIQRTQSLDSSVLGTRKSLTLVDKSSFKPISFTDYEGDFETIKATYHDDSVQIERPNQEDIVRPLYNCFDTFSVELILRTLPLKTGYVANLLCFNPMLNTEVDVRMKVIESEKGWRNPNERVDTLKVEVYFGETLQYYWIDPSRKEMLKQSSNIGDGLILEFRR
ncbi:hypothetical protein LCM10_03825 [Rossellomorea aquimaris]|uniref:DUF3108 domain-containing protein n=1 Tax=Rossellomorea aquimaris TaxID=189382 RepID=UPI001CD6EE8C|nr:hypothetical protein [Rossellomorea aquimaris]MCA1054104.1 hypothetical protein [Rossellomorea aquimaris]